MTNQIPTILAISGSLKSNSSNNAVIRAATELLQGQANFVLYDGLGNLPHFNDSQDPPETVTAFRKQIAEADGVFICSPEYAFGVPGSLKNALDWTVSSGEFINKPVALITAATGGDKAHSSLLLTLRVISSNLPDQCALLVSYIRSKMDPSGNVTDPATLTAIKGVLEALLQQIEIAKMEGGGQAG